MLKKLGLVFFIGYSCFSFTTDVRATDGEKPLFLFHKPSKKVLLTDRAWKRLLMRDLTFLEGNGAISLEEWIELDAFIRKQEEEPAEGFFIIKLREIRARDKSALKRAKIIPSPETLKK